MTVLGSVASGAEIIAGGSIHVYGALRGRAIAGSTGNGRARIFCRKFEAELSPSTASTRPPTTWTRSSAASPCRPGSTATRSCMTALD